MGANSRIPSITTESCPVQNPISSTGNGAALASLLFTLSLPLGGRAYSALPCAGAPPPQRPLSYNMPRRPGVDIGDGCPTERVSPNHAPPVPEPILLRQNRVTLSSPLYLPPHAQLTDSTVWSGLGPSLLVTCKAQLTETSIPQPVETRTKKMRENVTKMASILC